jgi:leader peptidase (prepilin peptidase)/N-methyltransferase
MKDAEAGQTVRVGAARSLCAHNGWIRGTLAGEYLSLAFLAWGLMTAAWWFAVSPRNAGAAVVMSAAGCWVAIRGARFFSGHVGTALVTAAFAAVCLSAGVIHLPGVPSWMLVSPIGPAAAGFVLLSVLGIDYLEYRQVVLDGRSIGDRRRWLGKELIIGGGLIWVIWSLGAAGYFHWSHQRELQGGQPDADEIGYWGRVGFHAGEGLVTFCALAFGLNVGSFLNVLVYRLPRGLDVISGLSRCPACGTAISGRDNVPVLGWLLLGGQCRACGVEISVEYPRVEAISAAGLMLLYFCELLTGGLTIPFRNPNLYAGVLWTVMYPKWDLIGMFALHGVLLSTLLTFSRLDVKGHRVSALACVVLVGAGVVTCSMFPHLLPVRMMALPALPGLQLQLSASSGSGFGGAVAGLAAAVVAAGCSGWAGGSVRQAAVSGISPRAGGLLCAGTVLGWQSVCSIMFLMWSAAGILSWWRERPVVQEFQSPGILYVAVLVHLLTWRWQWGVLAGF